MTDLKVCFIKSDDDFRQQDVQKCMSQYMCYPEWESTSSEFEVIQYIILIKLRMEMGNVSKRQQPDHRKNNNRRSPTGLQCNEKFPHPEASFS